MSEAGEIAAWLRKQAEADIEAAEASAPGPWILEEETGGFGPVAWISMPFGHPAVPGATCGLTRYMPLGAQDAETARHIARHDPLTETARAESVLAVLDDYERTAVIANPPECPQGETAGCDYLDALRELAALDHVVRLLAYGYRRREGFKEEWRP